MPYRKGTRPKVRPIHMVVPAQTLADLHDPVTVCGHRVNPGPKALSVSFSWSGVTCKCCLTSWKRKAGLV